MRRSALSAAAVLTAFTLAACGSTSAPTAAPNAPGPMMTAPTAAGDHNQADVMFAQMMIPHHEQAIEMATLASTRSDNPEVQALAAQIQTAQQPEIEQMRGWLASWGMPTMPAGRGPDGRGPAGTGPAGTGPDGMGPAGRGPDGRGPGGAMPGGPPAGPPGGWMSRGDMTKLEGLSGTEFDREFLTRMTAHHQTAITMAQAVQANGRHEPTKTLATNIIRTQTEEINQMAELLKTV
jgi:uncharacterized protein (DUF305 family)